MKLAFKYAGRMWGIYAVLALLSIFFVIGIGSEGWQLALGILLLVGFGVLLFNEGGYVGEKACTLGALLDRQVKEGRKIDQQQYSETWSVKNGVRALIVMVRWTCRSGRRSGRRWYRWIQRWRATGRARSGDRHEAEWRP